MKTKEHMFYFDDAGNSVAIDKAVKFRRLVVDANGKTLEESFGTIT